MNNHHLGVKKKGWNQGYFKNSFISVFFIIILVMFFALITSSQIIYLMTFGTSFYGATICHYQYTLNGIEKFNQQCF
jgi:uncharacterized membrane protein YiaA